MSRALTWAGASASSASTTSGGPRGTVGLGLLQRGRAAGGAAGGIPASVASTECGWQAGGQRETSGSSGKE